MRYVAVRIARISMVNQQMECYQSAQLVLALQWTVIR